MDRGVFHVGISGSYGGLNLGDEAILEAIIRQLRASVPAEITVLTRDADDTSRRHHVEHAVLARQMTREEARAEVAKFDLLILGGGGILYDRDAELYLREVALAHEVGVPVVVYAISAGPLADPSKRKLGARHLNSVAAITVRDRQGEIRERIARHLPELQERARETNLIVVRVLSKAHADRQVLQGT